MMSFGCKLRLHCKAQEKKFDNNIMPRVLVVDGINKFQAILSVTLIALLIGAFGVAFFPENPAKLLAPVSSGGLNDSEQRTLLLSSAPPQYRHVRRSIIDSSGGDIVRSWTEKNGTTPFRMRSAPFQPARYMSVAITGFNRTPAGRVYAYIECEDNSRRLELFRGGVNVNVNEAIIVTPPRWCPGMARVHLDSAEDGVYVGVGSVFEITFLSYLKKSFVGRVPYFVVALGIFSLVMFAGAAVGAKIGRGDQAVPIAFASLGMVALSVFYLVSAVPPHWRGAGLAAVSALVGFAIWRAGPIARSQAVRALAPYARVWGMASLFYFVILSLGVNGLGSWEPNYRFWPATWSSDNELPWMFAEAVRHGGNLRNLYGGGWLPTDRPPLMAGAYLLLTDVFSWMQAGNDGAYLLGQAYNAAAITLNALWVPAVWWLLTTLGQGMKDSERLAILVFVGCLPFVLFNTVYGWPKAFGAAFALVAFGLAWQAREPTNTRRWIIVSFFVLGSFSMLAHASTALFLAPLGIVFLWWTLRNHARSVLLGFGIALALLVSWSLYKYTVLPSSAPVTKYALTGDYGFGHPEWSLWEMLSERYGELTLWSWIKIKGTMLVQSFLPLNQPIAQIELNSDYGAGAIDKLRAWDFMLLSKGNVALPIFVVLAGWAVLARVRRNGSNGISSMMPFIVLIGIGLVSWLLLVAGFFAPVIIHHWPQAALFGLTLASVVVVQEEYPAIFKAILLLVMTYTCAVWILSPIHAALAIDPGAILAFSALCAWAAYRLILQNGRRNAFD